MTAYSHAEIVKVANSPDGTFMIEFVKRDDGLFQYRTFERRLEKSPVNEAYYWGLGERSGLYATLEELEKAARQTVAWLHETPTC